MFSKNLTEKKINIVAPQESWVLRDIGMKLNTSLQNMNFNSKFSSNVDHNADIVHWIGALGNKYVKTQINTGLLAHIDTFQKKISVYKHSSKMHALMCMSKSLSSKVVKWGWDQHRVYNSIIPPLSSLDNFVSSQKKYKIFVSTNLYPDRRKKENWILNFISKEYSNLNLHIDFMGTGWKELISNSHIRTTFTIDVHEKFEPIKYLSLLKSSDLCIYTGFDEGSMFICDALYNNKDILTSKQGWHNDLNLVESSYFENQQQFIDRLYQKISNFYAYETIKSLNFNKYAHDHCIMWSDILENPSKFHSHFLNLPSLSILKNEIGDL